MNTQRNPENLNSEAPNSAVQISAETKANTREQAEEIIDGLDGANLTATVKTLNGLTRGGYRVTVKQDAEYNEVQIRLYENTIREPIATGFIDRGHTNVTKFEAAAETRGIVRDYLCR